MLYYKTTEPVLESFLAIHVDMYTYDTVGETDWKILAIDVTDPLAEKLNGKWPYNWLLIYR